MEAKLRIAQWNASNTNTIAITEYTGTITVVTNPTIINGLTVTGSGECVSAFSASPTSVRIPSTVTSIIGGFLGCGKLTGVTIPAGVTNISEHAFAYTTSLTSFYLQGDAPAAGKYSDDGRDRARFLNK
jgi:hypothetical protein